MRLPVLHCVLASVVLSSAPSLAYSARLLAPDDAPVAGGGAGLTTAPVSAPRVASMMLVRGVAIGAGVTSTMLGLWLPSAVGGLTNNLIAAAIPSLLVMGLVAPALTVLISWLVANLHVAEADRAGFWLPFVGATLTHIALLVVGGFLGLSAANPLGLLAFSLIDGVAMAGVSTAIMSANRPEHPRAASLDTHSPGESQMNVVALSQVSF